MKVHDEIRELADKIAGKLSQKNVTLENFDYFKCIGILQETVAATKMIEFFKANTDIVKDFLLKYDLLVHAEKCAESVYNTQKEYDAYINGFWQGYKKAMAENNKKMKCFD